MAVWINEFHYDNTGTDTGEFIEVAGTAGTDLSGWSLVLYNGNPTQRNVYQTITLSGSIDNEQNGFGALSFAAPGLQNGGFPGTDIEPDAIALVHGTTVVQFLSYEGSATTGTFTAASGPAAGQTSVNIGLGIAEIGTEPTGLSLQLTGSGDDYADFTWAGPVTQSAGSLNAGQSFPPPEGETVFINDVSITEGDAGTSLLTFTVTRTGNTGAFTIDFATADGSATTADGDYEAASGQLSFTAGGALTQEISVVINGDTAAEADQGFSVVLSNLVDVSGTTTLGDDAGTGTILNDDVAFTEIAAIQGAGHKSSFVGGGVGAGGNSGAVRVNVEGVVTAIASNGFYIQDATPDGDVNTSDGIFVFTGTSGANFLAGQALDVGNTVHIMGARVDEFRPGSDLTITELSITSSISGSSVVNLGGDTDIAPVVLGVDREIPTGAIASDGFVTFDPAIYAADFWESLEGMVVEVPNPVAVGPTNEFRTRDPADPSNAAGPPSEELWVVTPGGFDPASQTPRGGLIIGATDYNPERIQLDDLLNSTDLPNVSVGTELSTVTGVVNYDFGNYEVLVSTAPTVVTPSTLAPEVTAITRDFRQITVADYNVENLDPKVESTAAGTVEGSDLYTRLGNSDDDVGSGKYALHAQHIAENLGAPAIVALQEIQDDDGAEISSVLSSDVTLQKLVDLIEATYGVHYEYAYVAPSASNINGGQPNANIRNAFLYQPDVVTLNNLFLLDPTNPAFDAGRKPLVGEFDFHGQTLTIINNHLNSKGGDGALFGDEQPPVLTSEAQRIEQAQVINDYVDGLLAANPNALVKVVGDLNDFTFSDPLKVLTGEADGNPVLHDLAAALLPENEQYSYVFEGNTQELDHQLASDALLDQAAPEFDIVHVNAEFAGSPSDHDPSVSRYDFSNLDELLRLSKGADSVDGAGGNDRIFGLAGADSLAGGAGDDVLKGGAGPDLFVFGPAGGTDKVKDFEKGADLLDLTAFASAGVHGLDDLTITVQASGLTRITMDEAPEVMIRLSLGGETLDASDFVFA